MKRLKKTSTKLGLAIMAGGFMSLANADHESLVGDSFTDYARVLSAEPVYETVIDTEPHESCWNERLRPARHHHRGHYQDRSTPMLVGAILGGALGNELGHHKRNKQVGAVLGGLLGGSIGRDIARQNHDNRGYHQDDRAGYRTVQRCETRYQEVEVQKLVAYEVSYRYRGKIYQAQTSEHPGDRLPLRVTVTPQF
ncbi:MAG: glycine zipper 2TM domain-containing protein [Pseudomonadales bacterium]|nr:glycine zipper 2TM domain-containing protein [Pseudomonadales bacterium]NNL12027.1 glycine zipper 2TM domain-containing protein [Pseudomonadales bacterium]